MSRATVLNPQPDTVTVIDLRGFPPRMLAEIAVPTSVVGPPMSVAIAPDESWLLWAQDDYRNTDIMMIAHYTSGHILRELMSRATVLRYNFMLTVQSGQVVEFHQLPEMPFGITRD